VPDVTSLMGSSWGLRGETARVRRAA
jgi:hypothetical protein